MKLARVLSPGLRVSWKRFEARSELAWHDHGMPTLCVVIAGAAAEEDARGTRARAIGDVVFRPLAVDRPNRLVAIINQDTTSSRPSLNVSAQDFDDWQAQSRSFRVMARYQGGETSIMLGNSADYAVVHLVSPGFFDTLGVRVAAGRLLNADEEQPGGPLAAVISDGFWNQRFNGDAKAIGATIKVRSDIFTGCPCNTVPISGSRITSSSCTSRSTKVSAFSKSNSFHAAPLSQND